MRKFMTLALLFGALFVGVFNDIQERALAAELKPLRIALGVNGLLWYPSFVARAAGYFHEEGYDDQWIDVGGSGTNAIAAVMGGDVDMTMQGLDHAMMASIQGADLVAFSALVNAYPLPLVLTKKALEKTGITDDMPVDEKIKRLKGLTIAVTSAGSGTDEILRNMLLVRHIDPDEDLHIQPLGSADAMLAAFSKNLIDGMVTTSPYPEIVETQGLGKTVISPLRGDLPEMQNVPYSAALATRTKTEQDPEMIAAVTRALAKAIKLTRDNPTKARDLLKQFFPKIEPAVFEKMEASYRQAAAKHTLIDRASFDKLVAWKNIAKAGSLKPSYEKAVVTTFAQKADAEILGEK
jgi:NitT/TauT family transport system substrate-binding protein